MIAQDDLPYLTVCGANAEPFRLGWAEAKSRLDTGKRCPFPKGSIARAAYMAAKAFHKELSQ